jgi:hypothetical protein
MSHVVRLIFVKKSKKPSLLLPLLLYMDAVSRLALGADDLLDCNIDWVKELVLSIIIKIYILIFIINSQQYFFYTLEDLKLYLEG